MDVFALLFVVSFLALVITLVVMHIRKCMNKGKGVIGRRKTYGFTKDKAARISLNTQKAYTRSYDLESSMMKREVNETQEKWKHTLPKHSTRIKLRNKRKGEEMSKVYILYKEDIFSNEENVDVVAVFSSYAAMLLWLKEQWSFESDVEDQDELGAYFSKYYTEDEVDYFLSYSVKDLIGETSHKTGKLVIKGR